MDNQSSLNELALFAGAGGGILGGHLLGWRTVCAVEWEPYAASVLVARQNDGILPPFPIWDDVQTFVGHSWRGIVDVISGGFPCQDISAAGKGAGITGDRSGMWKHMARIVGEVRPSYVFVENSPMLTIRGLGVVLADLSSLGFDAEWGVVSGKDTGAVHLRERIWIVATNTREERICRNVKKAIPQFATFPWGKDCRSIEDLRKRTELFPSPIHRRDYGLPDYVDRIAALGNAQIPRVAATAWEVLK